MNIIDLRSDTLTVPNQAMIEYMTKAKVGDDIYSEDPTINELQNQVADMFGFEKGLFTPTGTMANQIAISISTNNGDEIIADYNSHIFNYESAGSSYLSRVLIKPINSENGEISLSEIKSLINPEIYYLPRTSMVCIENTHNKLGGTTLSMEYIELISEFSKSNNLSLHLDGARIWNALKTNKYDVKSFGKLFTSISVCFSKGLGAPVGSMLLMPKEKYNQAIRMRKLFGGGMRQIGYLGACCKFAIENNFDRLSDDHTNAKNFAQIISQNKFIVPINLDKVETNIVIFKLKDIDLTYSFISKCKEKGIILSQMTPTLIRAVFYNGISYEQTIKAANILNEIQL